MEEVDVFIPCCVDEFCPQIGFDLISLIEKMGAKVNYNTEQTCCGRVLYDNGNWKEAKRLGEKFLADFSGKNMIVGCSASCLGYIKNNFGKLFYNTSYHNNYKSLSERIMDVSQFILAQKSDCELGAEFPFRVFLHNNCKSLNEYDIQEEVRFILSKVKGLTLVNKEVCDFCCGYGAGLYMYNEPVSTQLAKKKVEKALSLNAEYITSTDATCLMQLENYIQKNEIPNLRTIHLASLLMYSSNNK
ncbi:MAG: (Fe-S)-binding protein [Bacteroidota bacterium]|nr:(Fe-S)-binding protein [Bacteroidota bacterium]